jgi:AraC-like DNA-binding protein
LPSEWHVTPPQGDPPPPTLGQRTEEALRGIGCDDGQIAAVPAGFADQSHLTRVFVRQFGFTPGAYRRARQRRGKLSAQ